MVEWSEDMSASTEDIAYLNALVENINKHLGNEVFAIESTKDYEPECVDIFENKEPSCTYASFEDAELYLQGIETGVFLAKGLSDNDKAKRIYEQDS